MTAHTLSKGARAILGCRICQREDEPCRAHRDLAHKLPTFEHPAEEPEVELPLGAPDNNAPDNDYEPPTEVTEDEEGESDAETPEH